MTNETDIPDDDERDDQRERQEMDERREYEELLAAMYESTIVAAAWKLAEHMVEFGIPIPHGGVTEDVRRTYAYIIGVTGVDEYINPTPPPPERDSFDDDDQPF